MEWIDVPAHRVLKISRLEWDTRFDKLNENGEPCSKSFERIYCVVRDDGRVFRYPSYHIACDDYTDTVYLEEI